MKARSKRLAEESLPPESDDAVDGVSPTALAQTPAPGRACKCGQVSDALALFCSRCGRKFVEQSSLPQPNIKITGFITQRAAGRLEQIGRIHNWRTGTAIEQLINAYWLANSERIKVEIADLEMTHE